MFDTEPTSAELTSSRQRFANRPFHQWNTIFEPNPVVALETRTRFETHHRNRRIAPQESGDNSPEHGGMPKSESETTEKNRKPPPCGKNDPTAQAPPAYTHCLTGTDSNFEAFRCYPADRSFAALAFCNQQHLPTIRTKCSARTNIDYCRSTKFISRVKPTCLTTV